MCTILGDGKGERSQVLKGIEEVGKECRMRRGNEG